MGIVYLLFWVVFWAVVGAIASSKLYQSKHRRAETGAILGAVCGALGGILALVILWLIVAVLPAPDDSNEPVKLKNSAAPRLPWLDTLLRIGVLVLLFLIFSASIPHFGDERSVFNMLRMASLTTLLAMGITLVLLVRGIDFSLLALSAFASATLATMLAQENSVGAGIIAALMIGLLCGALQGILVAVRIPAYIVTLMGLGLWQSLTLATTGGSTIIVRDEGFTSMLRGTVGSLPAVFFGVVLLIIIGQVLISLTPVGKYIYAAGKSTRVQMPHAFVIVGVYTCAGLLAGIHAVLLTSYLASASTVTGSILIPVAAAVVGGASVSRSKGWLGGALIGALIMSLIMTFMIFQSVPSFYQDTVAAGVLLLAVIVDRIQAYLVQPNLRAESPDTAESPA